MKQWLVSVAVLLTMTGLLACQESGASEQGISRPFYTTPLAGVVEEHSLAVCSTHGFS